ncbi:MAG: hypothetical protein DVB26_04580 [Verrucomicrobia bacterium]|nr:MAG: hypothetical protein DVB26_04580 [Verrucomicrobiota bacterium]
MFRFALLLSLSFLASCAKHPLADAPASPAAAKSMSQRFNGPALKPASNGQWPEDVKKFTAFDSERKSAYFTEKSTLGKSYKTAAYAKTEWGGQTKEVSKKSYVGNTDGQRFNTPSRIQHDNAHESGAAAAVPDAYQTGNYQTSSAHENGAKRFAKPSNAQVDARRGVFPEPEVSSWKQERSLDLKATKSLLGHDGAQE